MNVIFKAMKFEQEEQEEIMESHENKNKSSVEKVRLIVNTVRSW